MKERVLFIGIEFVDPNFSGNGVYSRTIVKSLLSRNQVDVFVLCGRPAAEQGREIVISSHELEKFRVTSCNTGDGVATNNNAHGKLSVSVIPLKVWKKLGRHSSWEAFAENIKQNEDIKHKIQQFKPTIIFGVDWTSYQIFKGFRDILPNKIPFYYFVFRTFSAENALTDGERKWYIDKEQEAQINSTACVVLSKVDRKWNIDKFKMDKPSKCLILNPPLRQDFLQLYQNSNDTTAEKVERKYITCCSRLEPSKRPDRFVNLVCSMESFLKQIKVVPVLIGSKTDPIYSKELMIKLQKHFNIENNQECIILDFMKDPKELQKIWERTILNVHPALYESFGMTIVEASTFGAPSLLDTNASIGAEDLFYGNNRFDVDMSDINTATNYLKSLLLDRKLLIETGLRAQQIAVGWDDKAHSKGLELLLRNNV